MDCTISFCLIQDISKSEVKLPMYMYSTCQKNLPINGPFNGAPVPVQSCNFPCLLSLTQSGNRCE